MTVYCGRCGCPHDSGLCPECGSPEYGLNPGVLYDGWRRRQPFVQGELFADQWPEETDRAD